MNNFDLLLAFALATGMSIALIPILIKHAGLLGMIDAPDERKIHKQAIPRCGGLAIALSVLIVILLLVKLNPMTTGLLLGGSIIVIFGLLDDAIDLHYRWKFLGQILAVAVVMAVGVVFEKLPFFGLEDAPVWLTYPLTLLFIVGVTNAVNLSDGLDGLAAGTMLLSFAFIAAFAVYFGGLEIALVALATIGGLIGFLRFNTHPAIVFMGDSGSQFIGFIAANLSIILTQQLNPVFSPALPILILGLPILDTLSVMIQRLRAGKSPFSADKRHIHHKLMSYGLLHPQAVAIIYIIQSFFLFGAFIFRYSHFGIILSYFLFLTGCIFLTFYYATAQKVDFTSSQSSLKRRTPFWRQDWIFSCCRYYIELTLCLFLLVLSTVIYYHEQFNWVLEAKIFALAISITFIIPPKIQLFIVRLTFYIAGAISVYTIEISNFKDTLGVSIDIFFLLLLVVTSIAVRVTRKTYFTLNNQDLLVLLFIGVAITFINTDYLIRGLSYLCCLGYALEYLLNRDIYKYQILRCFSFTYLLNLGVFAWFQGWLITEIIL